MSGCAFSISSSTTHRVRRLADGVGEQAALVEADVARRRADEPRHRVLLHVLGHVEAQELDAHAPCASCLASSVLPTPVGPENRKEPIGLSGGAEARARQLDGRRRARRSPRSCPKMTFFSSGSSSRSASSSSMPTPTLGGILAILATTVLDLARRRASSCAARRAQPVDRAGLVDHVDRLVGQVAIVDVLGRQLRRRLAAPRRCRSTSWCSS